MCVCVSTLPSKCLAFQFRNKNFPVLFFWREAHLVVFWAYSWPCTQGSFLVEIREPRKVAGQNLSHTHSWRMQCARPSMYKLIPCCCSSPIRPAIGTIVFPQEPI